jgi:hypothetical protein
MSLVLLAGLAAAWGAEVSSKDLVDGAPIQLTGVTEIGGCPLENGKLAKCPAVYGALANELQIKVPVKRGSTPAEEVLFWSPPTGRVGGANITAKGDVGLNRDTPSDTREMLLAIPEVGFYRLVPQDGNWVLTDTKALEEVNKRREACEKGSSTECTVYVRGYSDEGEGVQHSIVFRQKQADPERDTDPPQECEELALQATRPNLLCFDLTGGSIVEHSNIPERLLPPNRALNVVVRHREGEDVGVTITGGTRGVTALGLDGPSGQASITHQGEGGGSDGKIVLTELTFSPRQSGGSLDVVVTRDGKQVRSAELEVETRYLGAVRVGLALGSAIDQSFGTATPPGSAQPEIVLTGGTTDAMQPELVVGFAPFLFEPRGRSYVQPRKAFSPKRLSPYLGLGVASLDSSAAVKFSLLKSVYMGFEYELGRNASFGLAAQLRQVTRLADPFELGSPYSGGTVPTVSTYSPGIAVFFNVSPDFFRFVQPLTK